MLTTTLKACFPPGLYVQLTLPLESLPGRPCLLMTPNSIHSALQHGHACDSSPPAARSIYHLPDFQIHGTSFSTCSKFSVSSSFSRAALSPFLDCWQYCPLTMSHTRHRGITLYPSLPSPPELISHPDLPVFYPKYFSGLSPVSRVLFSGTDGQKGHLPSMARNSSWIPQLTRGSHILTKLCRQGSRSAAEAQSELCFSAWCI